MSRREGDRLFGANFWGRHLGRAAAAHPLHRQ